MKHLVRGTAGMIVAASLVACYDYPSAAINNDNFHIVNANPVIGFIAKPGDSLQVLLRLTNDANTGTLTSWTITNPNPDGIEVHYDALYRPIYTGDTTTAPETDKNQQRYFVLAKAPGVYTFTATPTANTGVAGTITIRVQPGDLGASLKQTVRTNGQVDTVVAPAYIKFIPGTTTITMTTAAGSTRAITAANTTITADSSMAIFTVATGDTGVVQVNNLIWNIPGIDPTYRITSLKTTNALTTVP